ncbi:MAG: peptidoglycan endopeptidase [Pedobacter sp.]|nr:MAG: peptidoglycan endopeptidase [Pedobacter sp.]
MKRILTSFCFVCLFATAGQAQTVSSKMQHVVQQLISALPVQQPANQLIGFAKTLIGVPYHYASSNPQRGFDCSGFVSYVFHNFGFNVPRSSSEFSNTGTPVDLSKAKVGDVLIFTGTNPKVRTVGHVGIIYSIDGDEIQFIHATSGKANAVTITPLNDYYKGRFLKAISII